MAVSSSVALTNCPACETKLRPGQSPCPKCGMTAPRMVELQRAKLQAEVRGLGKTAVSVEREPGAWRPLVRPTMKGMLLLLIATVLIGGGYALYRGFTRPPYEPWKAYPTNAQALATQVFNLIATDQETEHDKIYALLSMQVKNEQDPEQRGYYRQLFHEIHKYLAGEFGAGWNATMKVEPADPKKGTEETVYVVTVGPETLHLVVEPQGPEKGPAPVPAHYGVVGIAEFSISGAGKAQQMGAIGGVLRGLGAEGSAAQLGGIVAMSAGNAHETPMDIKRRLLPTVRSPGNAALKYTLLQLWPVRQDPTVRARLESIMQDARYNPEMQATAKAVYESTVSDEDLIAARVPLN